MSGGCKLEYPEGESWNSIYPCDEEYRKIAEDIVEEYPQGVLMLEEGKFREDVSDFFDRYFSKSYVLKASIALGYAADKNAESPSHHEKLGKNVFRGANKFLDSGHLDSLKKPLEGESVHITQDELHGGIRLGYYANGTDITDFLEIDSRDNLRRTPENNFRVGTVEEQDERISVSNFVSQIKSSLK